MPCCYAYADTDTYAYADTYVHAYAHTDAHADTHAYAHTDAHTHSITRTDACTHASAIHSRADYAGHQPCPCPAEPHPASQGPPRPRQSPQRKLEPEQRQSPDPQSEQQAAYRHHPRCEARPSSDSGQDHVPARQKQDGPPVDQGRPAVKQLNQKTDGTIAVSFVVLRCYDALNFCLAVLMSVTGASLVGYQPRLCISQNSSDWI